VTVDVVIPTYNNASQLSNCLDALERQTAPNVRALVCIDGSTDGTLDLLTGRRGALPLVVLEHADRQNHGRAATRNLGVASATAELVVFLDSDVRLEPDAIAMHVQVLDHNDCVSVGDVRYEPNDADLWGRYQATRGKHKANRSGEIRPLDFNTQNAALRRSHLVACGGFDESLSGYGGEDTELGLRLAADRGLTFVYNGAAIASTVERKSVDDALRQLDGYARTGLRQIRARHPTGPAPFWTDRLESARPGDGLLRALSNPALEWIARRLLPLSPFALQRHLLDYLVFRTVSRGYLEGLR
jgi:glycosyltransferase involved in cell wall biosynthesis